MANKRITKDTVDINGRTVLYDNVVHNVSFYDTTAEDWSLVTDKSWYDESKYPYDSFLSTVGFDGRWSWFKERGDFFYTLSSGLVLSISGSPSRCGLSSQDKWYFTDDFIIKLYINEDLYYNEYRSNAAFGISVSKDSSTKARVSRYFDYDAFDIGYAFHTVSGYAPRYIGWTKEEFVPSSVTGDTVALCLERTGTNISAFVTNSNETITVASGYDFTSLSGTVYVEIEADTDQYNMFSCGASGLTCSGSVRSFSSFEQSDTGGIVGFPSNAIVVSDGFGISILDEQDASLAYRFRNIGGFDYVTSSGIIAAGAGHVFSTTASGSVDIDFKNDSIRTHTRNGVWVKNGAISDRNMRTYDTLSSYQTVVTGDYVASIDIQDSVSGVLVAVGNSNGLSVSKDSVVAHHVSASGIVDAVSFSDTGGLWWHECIEAQENGLLYTVNDVSSAVDAVSFSHDASYSVSSGDISAVSCNALSVSDSGFIVALAHSAGLDVLKAGVLYKYGAVGSHEAVFDGLFESALGIYWTGGHTMVFSNYMIYSTIHWSGSGRCAKLGFKGTQLLFAGNDVYMSQMVDLDDISSLFFDVHTVNDEAINIGYYLKFFVGTKEEYSIPINNTHTYLNIPIDVSSYKGNNFIKFQVVCTENSVPNENIYAMISNVTTMPINYTHKILTSIDNNIRDCKILGSYGKEKLFYSTKDGHGCIDLATNTEDFFETRDFEVYSFDAYRL